MEKLMRVLFLLLCAAMLAYGLALEKHEVRSLGTHEPKVMSGMKFVEGMTTDDFMLKGSRLYDVRSLQPGAASVKDCKT